MKNDKGNKYTFLLKNTVLFTIANFSNKLIVFLLLPFYTAFLTTDEYAIIDIISVVQQLIFPIITLGITEAVVRFGIEKSGNKKNVFIIGLGFVLIGNIILTIGCLSCVALSIGVKKYIIYFLIFNCVISLNSLLSAFLRTVDRVGLITISSIINTIIATVLNIFLIANMKLGVDGYYVSFILGNVVAILIMVAGSYKLIITNKVDHISLKKDLFDMMKFSIPLIPNGIFWWINSSLDRIFLSSISGLSCVGMYAAANKIPGILTTITGIFQQSWGLSIFKENDSKDKKEFFNKIYHFYYYSIFFITLVLIGFTRLICRFLLSKEFFLAWSWVPTLILAFYFNSISAFIGTEFTASKKTYWILITTFFSAVINIVFNILLIPSLNGSGAAIATCVSCFFLLEIRVYVINKKFDLDINNKSILLNTLILLIMTIVVIKLDVVLSFVIFMIFFAFCIFINFRFIKNILYFFKKELLRNEKNSR